ncbi:MAG: hypothetical protein HOV77_31905 [Hamadaea sp.]|uniref:hypothetical protein n=1 Tax=Hamadaea sp. TaxID=2024425 RepID=UPI0018202C93|nr:hypothetical protein [Hamadaea sp.]NUT23792.1 hypothetical protein [Hamadaea sp.]
MIPPRPTLRCLEEDLKVPIPAIDDPLDEIDHPIIRKAVEQFGERESRHERIRSIDDQVLFKVKVQRWRGAVWVEPELPWLIAAGWRESGSADDFYAALAADGQSARAHYNAAHKRALTTDTYIMDFLPQRDDRLRLQAEAGLRFVRVLESLIPRLLRESLQDGREHRVELDSFGLGIQVRADHGHETYVAIRITGSVPGNVTLVILDIVPGCDRSGWFPEATLPDRPLAGNEQARSNIMDPTAAARLLESES